MTTAAAARAVSAKPRSGARPTRSASAAHNIQNKRVAMMAVGDHVVLAQRASSVMISLGIVSPVDDVLIISTLKSHVIAIVDVAMGAEPGGSVITLR